MRRSSTLSLLLFLGGPALITCALNTQGLPSDEASSSTSGGSAGSTSTTGGSTGSEGSTSTTGGACDTMQDPSNCGQCGYKCSDSGATSVLCVDGRCVPTCLPGRLDCATPSPAPDDGCEATDQDDNHCGFCGNDCTVDKRSCQKIDNLYRCACGPATECGLAGAEAQCLFEKCKCFNNGVEGHHCAHGEICAGSDVCLCNGGPSCTDTLQPDGHELEVCCPGTGCTNLRDNPMSCGACGHACPVPLQCVDGVCK